MLQYIYPLNIPMAYCNDSRKYCKAKTTRFRRFFRVKEPRHHPENLPPENCYTSIVARAPC